MTDRPRLTIREAAARARVAEAEIAAARRSGQLVGELRGDLWLFSRAAVDAWSASRPRCRATIGDLVAMRRR